MGIKTVFISDCHLGCRYSRTKELLEFLDELKNSKTLEHVYIVGDFVDGWRLKRNPKNWSDECTLVIRKVLTLVKRGVKITYLAGNHDEFLRHFIKDFGNEFGKIVFTNEAIHRRVNGESVLVIHGDQYDYSVLYAKWLCVLGDIGYDLLLVANNVTEKLQDIFLAKRRFSLSKAIKSQVKQAITYISDFEEFLTRRARQKGCSMVIAGHIHIPAIKVVNNTWYLNTGDWVENSTAIIENTDGSLFLQQYQCASARKLSEISSSEPEGAGNPPRTTPPVLASCQDPVSSQTK